MVLIKNVKVYAPEYLGVKDVLVCNEKIEWIGDAMECRTKSPNSQSDIADEARILPFSYEHISCEVIDGTGKILIPGLIDQHVHIIGGGGEGSFRTRAPEMKLSEMIENGITTVVGLLGTDGMTRSVENLYAKAMALTEEGVTAYILTGSYDYPSPTITGSIEKDLMFVHNVLGLKLAISDHRAPNVTLDELIQIASKMRVHGMLCGKPGFVALHMGDGKQGLIPVFEALAYTQIPVKIFRPTHVNRNPRLLEQGYELLDMGGYVDFTCGSDGQPSPGQCILDAKKRRLPLNHITISSDGHGSWSKYDEAGNLMEIGIATMDALWKELKDMVRKLEIPLEEALTYVTSNVAEGLGFSGKKGSILVGADADLVLMDENFEIDTVLARGNIMMREGVLLRKGTYEKLNISVSDDI